jgi:starch-binding outer membrane protein, SusD/RagB family
MKIYNNIIKTLTFALAGSLAISGCTKLHETLTSSLTQAESAEFSPLFLAQAYTDIGLVWDDPSNVSQAEEVTGDDVFLPVRGGDWSDGGEHIALHMHTWVRQDGTTALFETLFEGLNKMNYDATTVLGTNGTADQLAQARFIRALALYQLLDFFGQFPLRQPGDNLLTAPPVYTGDSAVLFIESELNSCITNLSPGNSTSIANQDAARTLLMKLLLNRGAFDTRATPTFAAADMQQVITLGNTILGNSAHSLDTNYFNMFLPTNSNDPETIYSLPNTAVSKTNGTSNYTNMQNRWFATGHYNQYDALAPNSGWNGFSIPGEFYNSFAVNSDALTQTPKDTSYDLRLGGRYVVNETNVSGIRPGIEIGQQYSETGAPDSDRLHHLLIYTNGEEVPASIDVTGLLSVETAGFRIMKYAPDFSQTKTSYANPGNYYIMFRLADVMLMVAEAEMRTGDNTDALILVNKLRAARKAPAITSAFSLQSTSANFYDGNNLLAERGREFWWEGQRRTDLIRFGVWTQAWRLKSADNGIRYTFPIPLDDLSSNPNLLPNIQGTTY